MKYKLKLLDENQHIENSIILDKIDSIDNILFVRCGKDFDISKLEDIIPLLKGVIYENVVFIDENVEFLTVEEIDE